MFSFRWVHATEQMIPFVYSSRNLQINELKEIIFVTRDVNLCYFANGSNTCTEYMFYCVGCLLRK